MSLTRHEEGSLRELFAIALPLIITSFSVMLMIFVDRIFLAKYSPAAMCAATNASTLGWSMIFGFQILTSIAEVFVAQFNGAGKTDRLGEPVWQMIWVSVATSLFFIPVGLWGGSYFFRGSPFCQMEAEYFQAFVLPGSFHACYCALASFWIGRGKLATITWLAVAMNLLNAFLDVLLIFGVEGWVKPMGCQGAAIATSVGVVFQVGALMYLFLSRKNREAFGTGEMSVYWPLMRDCLKIGAPSATFAALELVGWAIFYRMMTAMGEHYIIVASICQSVALMLWACTDGLGKAATTVAGNMIGAERAHLIPKVMRSGLRFLLIMLVVYLVAVMVGSSYIIKEFIDVTAFADGAILYKALSVSLLWTVIYIFFEGLRLLFAGLLTAAGDTMYLMIGGTLSVWLGLLLPTKALVMPFGFSVDVAMSVWAFYAAAAALVYYARFSLGKWREAALIAV